MTDDRLFNEQESKYGYVDGLTDALKIIEGMVENNSIIQSWNFVAKRAGDAIRHKIKECEP